MTRTQTFPYVLFRPLIKNGGGYDFDLMSTSKIYPLIKNKSPLQWLEPNLLQLTATMGKVFDRQVLWPRHCHQNLGELEPNVRLYSRNLVLCLR